MALSNPLVERQSEKSQPMPPAWPGTEHAKATLRRNNTNGHLSESLGQELASKQKLQGLMVDSGPTSSMKQASKGKQEKKVKGSCRCWPFSWCCG